MNNKLYTILGKALILLVLSHLSFVDSYAGIYNYDGIIANLNKKLSSDCTPGDSITILTNIFDILQVSGSPKADSIAEQI